MIALKPEKGHLLIAEPSIIGDVSFNRSVVLLANHNDTGSVGFIMNKPLEFKLNELIPEITKDFDVFNGGPVEQDNLYFIHRVPDTITDSIEISHGIYWGGNFDSAVLGIQSGEIDVGDIRFFLGYSGWDADQLESELSSNSWVIIENSYKSTIIEKCCENFWKQKMIEFGGDYQIWSNAPENPSYN